LVFSYLDFRFLLKSQAIKVDCIKNYIIIHLGSERAIYEQACRKSRGPLTTQGPKSISARANRKWRKLAGCLVVRSYVQQADKQPEVIISGLLFFGSFLLEEQKK
jgi:hypothetical protein